MEVEDPGPAIDSISGCSTGSIETSAPQTEPAPKNSKLANQTIPPNEDHLLLENLTSVNQRRTLSTFNSITVETDVNPVVNL